MFQTRSPVNSGSGCGFSTVVASKLGMSTVGVFPTRFQVSSGSVCGFSTVVASKLGLSTVGVQYFKLVSRLTLVLFVVCQGRCIQTWSVNGWCVSNSCSG